MRRLPTPSPAAGGRLRRGLIWVLSAVALVSLAGAAIGGAQMLRTPLGAQLIDRGSAGIVAAMDRAMARHATPERIAQRLRQLLEEEPRNWLALEAVRSVADEREIAVPPDLADRIARAWDADHSPWALIADCGACFWDPAVCGFSLALACQTPMVLTPLGDVAGLSRAAIAYANGGEIDRVDAGLSAIGLAATVALVASGGGSQSVAMGSRGMRLARRMGMVTPSLERMTGRAVRDGLDWPALSRARTATDVRGAVRPAAIAPVVETVSALERVRRRLGGPAMLHLLRYVEGPADARRLANATQALGPRTVGRIEVLGKARFLRATVRLTNAARLLIGSAIAALLALLGLAGSLLVSALARRARRAVVR